MGIYEKEKLLSVWWRKEMEAEREAEEAVDSDMDKSYVQFLFFMLPVDSSLIRVLRLCKKI